jgi:hypothetical protein
MVASSDLPSSVAQAREMTIVSSLYPFPSSPLHSPNTDAWDPRVRLSSTSYDLPLHRVWSADCCSRVVSPPYASSVTTPNAPIVCRPQRSGCLSPPTSLADASLATATTHQLVATPSPRWGRHGARRCADPAILLLVVVPQLDVVVVSLSAAALAAGEEYLGPLSGFW